MKKLIYTLGVLSICTTGFAQSSISADFAVNSVAPLSPSIDINQKSQIQVQISNFGPDILPSGKAKLTLSFIKDYIEYDSLRPLFDSCGNKWTIVNSEIVNNTRSVNLTNVLPLSINEICYIKVPVKGMGSVTNSVLGVTSAVVGISDPNGNNQSANSSISVSNVVLGIDLLSFASSDKGCSQAEIVWKTSMENNLSYFEIEGSTNAKDFATIAKVKGQNNKQGAVYQQMVEQKETIVYYRLKSVDFDGKTSYSNIIKSELGCISLPITVSPNPSNGIFTISGLTEGANIKVTTINGREILVNNHVIDYTKIDLSTFAAGVYFLQVTTNTGVITHFKLIKN